jgi:uncharacterized protein
MRVAVTGSSGFIGSALCRELRDGGHDVIRVVRRAAPGRGQVVWDPAAGAIDAAGLAGVEGVVHLAGAGIGDKRWSATRRKLLVSSRVNSTALLARTLARLDPVPRVLLSASAVGFYGDRGDEVLSEESAGGTGFLADLCRQWEQATDTAAEAGIRTVHLRSGIVLSPAGGVLARQLPLYRLGLGGRLGSGRQWWSWVSLEDEGRAALFLLEHEELSGPVNLVAPEPVTNRLFTVALARALRRPALLPVPALALRVAFGRGFVDEVLLASQRVRPDALERAGFAFRQPEIDSALAAILAG